MSEQMSKIGDDILEGMEEMLAHVNGKPIGAVLHHVDIESVDPKAIRRRLKITQTKMAALLGVSVSGYRKWEQGQARPSGAARTLLMVMDREPKAVLRALTTAV